MHATPKIDGKPAKRARIKDYREAPLPDVDGGEYVRDSFIALGMAGEGALSWQEIDAYARLTGEIGDPWEAHVIRAMSIAYLDGMRLGEDPLAIPPIEQGKNDTHAS